MSKPNDNEIKTKVVNQLEYYLSDVNLRSDHFLKKLVKKDPGWVSIDLLMKCNRLKSLVSDDKNVLIKVLQTMKSDLIEVDLNFGIRRRVVPDMNEEFKRSIDEKTVEVNGFPKDVALDELIEWSKQFGSVLSVKMKRSETNHDFNGSANIIFKDKEMAETFLNQMILKFKDIELSKSQLNPIEIKPKDVNKVLKDLANKVEKMDTSSPECETIVESEGVVLHLKGLPRKLVAQEKRKKSNKIKNFFSSYGRVVNISTDGSGNCLVQFENQSVAQKVLDSNEVIEESLDVIDPHGPNGRLDPIGSKKVVHKLNFNGKEVTIRKLSANEELNFWTKVNKLKKTKAMKPKKVKKSKKRSNSIITSEQETKRLTSRPP